MRHAQTFLDLSSDDHIEVPPELSSGSGDLLQKVFDTTRNSNVAHTKPTEKATHTFKLRTLQKLPPRHLLWSPNFGGVTMGPPEKSGV